MKELTLLIQSWPLLFKGAWVSIEIAMTAMVIGLIGGLMLGVLNCQRFTHSILGVFLKGFIWVVRGTPLFVQVLVIYYALPELLGFSLSPFVAGVTALGLNSTAYISEIVRSGLNAIPVGQWEASYVLGMGQWQTLQKVIFPQMFPIALPGLINELTSLIKETSILMVIGVAELTKVSKDIVARELDPMTIFLAAAFLYLLMTSSVAALAQKLPKKSLT